MFVNEKAVSFLLLLLMPPFDRLAERVELALVERPRSAPTPLLLLLCAEDERAPAVCDLDETTDDEEEPLFPAGRG